MIDLAKATTLAIDRAISRYTHPDYPRTVALRKAYTAFITGEGLDERMRRFKRRESDEDFKQRKALTIHITKAIVSAMMGPERKLVNVKPVVDSITYGKDNDTAVQTLRDLCSTFYGGKDVDHYLGTLVDPSEADPNGFVVLAFDNFDFRYEKPLTYPFRIAADNVWDFEYFNGRLQYLWSRFVIQYVIEDGIMDPITGKVGKPKTKDGDRFVFYADNHHIVFEQVKDTLADKKEGVLMTADGQPVEVTGDGSVVFGKEAQPRYFLRSAKDTLYVVTFYNQKSGQVPAFRMGCKPDALTDGRTCVNLWDQAVPFLDKVLMVTSELDLTRHLHTFPQKVQHGPKCTAEGCNAGTMVDNGADCTECHGTGLKTTHTSAQDILILPWPARGEELKDLSNIVHYIHPPVELLELMTKIEKEIKDDAIRAVYGSDIYVKNTVASTATEKVVEQQSIYDTLQPRASWWSESRTTTTHVVANYNDQGEGLRVVHRFPRRLAFESTAELFALRKDAEGTDPATIIALDRDIRESVLIDDPDAAKKAETWAHFNPFPGKSEGTVMALLAGGLASKRSALMWTEQATIFARAEKEFDGKPVNFYGQEQTKQEEVIEKIIEDMLGTDADKPMLSMELGTDPAMDAPDAGVDPNATDANSAVKDTSLNGAQVASLVEVISLVATGVLTKETASAMIQAAFPAIDPSLVAAMLANVKTVAPEAIRAADQVRNPRTEAGSGTPPSDPNAEPAKQAA